MEAGVEQVKQAQRASWTAGDYPNVATLIVEVSEKLVERLAPAAGAELLDVATGTGNLAIPAAAGGARVTGLDLTPALLEVARARATEAGADVTWVEGDAEALPFEDSSFDYVTSVFGVIFAPRHAIAAAELARVCRPGGKLGLCAWTPAGMPGTMFKVLGSYAPPPPPFASPPFAWGEEGHVKELLDDAFELEMERTTVPFEFESLDSAMSFYQEKFGPLVLAGPALREAGRWDALVADLRQLLESFNEADDGSVRFPGEYLRVVGTRR